MTGINRSVEVTRSTLDPDDISKLNATSIIGYMQAAIACILTFIFYIIADTNEVGLWVEITILILGSLALGISIYMTIRARKNILKGEKEVTKGYIWDIVEEFETQIIAGKHSKAGGIRNYILKVGNIEHCFYKYSHSYKFSHQDSKYDKKQEAYNVGDLVSMHYTLSGSLMRISVDKKVATPVDKDFSIHKIVHIDHKVVSDREIINYYPRQANFEQYDSKQCYYFHVNDQLYCIPEELFLKYPAQTPIKILKDEEGELTKHIYIQNPNDSWEEVQLEKSL